MTILNKTIILTAYTVAAFASFSCIAKESYPDRPVTYVVPNAPGGSGDVIARALSDILGKDLGTPVIIDYKPGAAGVIGAEFVARARPDGYTLLVSSTGPMSIVPSLNPNLPISMEKAFTPVIKIAESTTVLAVSAHSPWHTIQDLVRASKEAPGTFSFASGGTGTVLHLQGEMLKMRTGIDAIHVPYKGDAPAVSDLLAGHVSMMFVPTQAVAAQVHAGLIRILATTSPQRLSAMPDVPTMTEAGVPDFAGSAWFGAFVPAGTPGAIVQRLNSSLNGALKDPLVIKRLKTLGLTPAGGDPQALQVAQDADLKRWKEVIRAAHIQTGS